MDERDPEWLPPTPAEPNAGGPPARPEQPPGAEPQPPGAEPLPSGPPTPPPPGYYYVPPGGYPPYPTTGLPGYDTGPGNGQAVAGFVLSTTSIALLVFSAGLSSVVSLACAILGIVYSRKGRARVQAGQTSKHEGLAQAGFIVGVVAVVASVLATIAWILLAIFADWSDDTSSGDEFRISVVVRLATLAVRAVAI